MPRHTHPDPLSEANKLVVEFSGRTHSTNLPPNIRLLQTNLQEERVSIVNEKAAEEGDSDTPFTLKELRRTYKSHSRSAPGPDGISYPIISKLGPTGERVLLRLINLTWEKSRIPSGWKKTEITPIPKPKDPGKFRPISLLSCLSKTAERMVLNRLQWKLGPPPENLHGFTKGMSTAHSISTLLATINASPSVVIFLDLEKAFELANPLAILEGLARRGIRGKLLSWIREYFRERSARIRFQGHLSGYLPLENGTPQGGVLSPALFNILMSGILELRLPTGCKVISYADDLAIAAIGRHALTHAQRSLDLVSEECNRVGLKISADKSKAMVLRVKPRNTRLRVQGMELEWVDAYQYLGVWVDNRLQFSKELRYLIDRLKPRITVMKAMSGPKIGASHKVLKSFYTHAIRPIVDYASIALIKAPKALKGKIETLQNEVLRIILGAPRWAKVINLRLEAGILPIEHRMDLMAANFFAKVIQTPQDTFLRTKLIRQIELDPDLFANNTWLFNTRRVLNRFEAIEALMEKGMDTPHPDYRVPPPWERYTPEFPKFEIQGKKANHFPPELKARADEFIAGITPPGSTTYYTDGSVNPDDKTAGAGLITRTFYKAFRISDNASTLQAEAAAILAALTHALEGRGDVVIHTDSKATIESLICSVPKDNIHLLTTILAKAQSILSQGRRVIINWVPSHIGIKGNEAADRLAESGRLKPQIDLPLKKSKSMIKKAICQAGLATNKQRHMWAAQRSPSARWYRDATGYKALISPFKLSRRAEVILHRMRLGYHCRWEIIEADDAHHCNLCGSPYGNLIHYLRECTHTAFLRVRQYESEPLRVNWLASALTPELVERLVANPPPR